MSETIISLVAVGRNDNYGGDFRSRLQSFVTWSSEQITKAKVRSEIIFVNYNPLLVEGPIEQFIEWPTSNEWVKVRVITVPPEVHAQVVADSHVKNVPVLEYVAKNVGIRRANGKFILAMNPDILMSESLFRNFHRLSGSVYYRANRLDHNFEGTIDHSRQLYDQLRSHVSTVWFQGSHTDVKGFSSFEYMRQWFLKTCQNLWWRNTVHFEKILNHYSMPVYYHNIEYRFHCNASGDFMLMDRQSWYRLKGYKQSSYISLHVDSLMVLQAAFAGLKGTTLFGPIYHRQHERRYDAINKETEDQRAVYENYKKEVEKMDSAKRPVLYNDENWGLANVQLSEKML